MFDQSDESFKLTDAERKTALKSATVGLLYLLLVIVVLVTGAHGIMLVLSQESGVVEFAGLWGSILNALRISFPVTVEIAAVVAGLGFISARWRKNQVWVALAIEVIWIVFAAANMITFFAIERGVPLEGWQLKWIGVGLPVSALVAGIFTYMLKRTDPDNQRKMEEEAALEAADMIRFAARRDVMTSPQMRAIERQKQWLEFVNKLRMAGYDENQINFILADTPQLLIDRNGNGRPDLLESGNHANGSTRPSANGTPVRMAAEGHPAPTARAIRTNWTLDDIFAAVAEKAGLSESADALTIYEEMTRQSGIHTRGLTGQRSQSFVPRRNQLAEWLGVSVDERPYFAPAADRFLDPGESVERELHSRLTDPNGRPLPIIDWQGEPQRPR